MMNKGRILAIDFGERRMGLAISDPDRILASGLTTLIVKNTRDAIGQLKEIVCKHEINLVIVGLPLLTDGTHGAKAGKVLSFCECLRENLTVPVQLIDERFSTITAQRMLLESETKKKRRTKEKIDELAAVVILRHYLDCSSA